MLKLKKDVDFTELIKYGFKEDEANCEFGDHYYSSNNYYYQVNANFRVAVNMLSRDISILCLSSNEVTLYNMSDLAPIVDLIKAALVEFDGVGVVSDLTVQEQAIWEHYKKIEAENYHLKNQLSNKNKIIKGLKNEIKDWKKKFYSITQNRKPKFRNNGKAGKGKN